jgi:membrane associated rhomboid family serine protease
MVATTGFIYKREVMGIYDRDYYRKDHGGRNPVFSVFDSAIATLIAANVLVWVLQLAGGDKVTDLLAASGRDVFELRLWKLFTANFAHSTDGIWHLVGNMLFLYFFGRELEQIYGRRDFYTLYLSAGILAVLAEVTLHHFAPGEDDFRVLGASGAVMAIVVVFTLFYPQRLIYFFFFVPLPAWILCIIFLLLDLAGLTGRSGRGIANLAHLTGATVGFLYWFFDLRWDGLMRRLPSREKSRRRRGKILQPGAVFKEARQKVEHDSVSRRIDELLQKIHEKKELSEEELTFLKENSGRYRSRD